MVYASIAIIALLVGALTATYLLRKPTNPTDAALDSLEASHQREHEADEAEAKTADPADYLNSGLDGVR